MDLPCDFDVEFAHVSIRTQLFPLSLSINKDRVLLHSDILVNILNLVIATNTRMQSKYTKIPQNGVLTVDIIIN